MPLNHSPVFQPDHIHIWHIDLDHDTGEIDAASILNEEEELRAQRLVSPENQRHWIRGRIALRLILGRYIQIPPQDITFEYGPHGKPSIHSGPNFNLSHAGNRALLALCPSRALGIDVETPDRRLSHRKLAQRVLSPSELSDFSASPDSETFLQMWTRKEAYLKGVASGISLPLNQISIQLETEQRYRVQHQPSGHNNVRWCCFNLSLEQGYIGAVATPLPAPSIVDFYWKDES